MKLSTKISLGFLVVLGLHIVVAVMGHLGQQRARSDLRQLEDGNRLTQRMLEIDRLIGELQGAVQGYTFSGNRGLALRSERTYERVTEQLASVYEVLPEAERDDVDAMRESLAAYARNFRAAVEDRSRREQLVQYDLPALDQRAASALAEVRLASGDVEGHGPELALREVGHYLLVAQNGAHQYLAQLDSHAMQDARDAIGDVRELVHGDDRLEPFLGPICDDYERALLGLVQSTRGYLHLVHVVMAAEAVEFLRSSAGLRERALGRVEALQHAVVEQQEGYQVWSTSISLATILLGLFAGAVVGRLVVGPLQAITTTLGRMTRGEHGAIPGLGRPDEIGDMAMAAQQLRDRSEEAERLLAETARLSAQRERMIEDLERTNRDLDNFAHIASHDLKAPLRAIATIVRWLGEDCGDELPDAARDHLARLTQRVGRMSQLLADLQDYSKASRKSELLREVDVRELARGAAAMSDEVAYPVEMTGAREARLIAAPVPITQVFANLISNAVQHHDRVEGRITIDLQPTPDGMTISVTDDGPGVPPEHHARIFEPFQTLHAREDRENSGVGLAIVKKLVERYGGSIEVQSPVLDGRGARFVVRWPNGRLPAQRAAAAQAAQPAAD